MCAGVLIGSLADDVVGTSESTSNDAWDVAGVSCSDGAATVDVCDLVCPSVSSATVSTTGSCPGSVTVCPGSVAAWPLSALISETLPVSSTNSSLLRVGSSNGVLALCDCGAFRRLRPRAEGGNGSAGACPCHENHGTFILSVRTFVNAQVLLTGG